MAIAGLGSLRGTEVEVDDVPGPYEESR